MTTAEWLTKVGPYKVEHVPAPGPSEPWDRWVPAKGLLHTTEGSNVEGALSVFRVHFRPKFTVGRDRKRKVRILQHSPLSRMDAALANLAGGVETNRHVRVQVEIVGFSQSHTWLPSSEVTDALAHLLLVCRDRLDIPLRHRSVNRDVKLWDKTAGWVGHRDAPENNHIDPGALDYSALFRRCAELGPHLKVKARKKPRKIVRPYRLCRLANGIPYTTNDPCPTKEA